MKIKLWLAGIIATLAALAGFAGGIYCARLPHSPAVAPRTVALRADPAKDARIAKLVKIYHEGRPFEPSATYAERQRRRYLAKEALSREDPIVLVSADEVERRADAREGAKVVDNMLANDQ